ncbi:MAG: hypothetical protein V4568_15160 [Pseudomonadota bacterium]
MIHDLKKYLMATLCFFVSALAFAEDLNSTRSYPLPDHGRIELSIPTSWQEKVRQPPNNFPPTIIFTPQAGTAFKVLLTPMWHMSKEVAMPKIENLKEEVEYAAENVKSRSVEESIPIKEIKGIEGTGYYFSATDRAPKKGEFKYSTQGLLPIGELMAVFTVLSNDSEDGANSDALAMLASAIHVKDAAP